MTAHRLLDGLRVVLVEDGWLHQDLMQPARGQEQERWHKNRHNSQKTVDW